jgi:shikimate kinase
VADQVVLVGMMGAGKSTVGRLLASRLGWAHVDTDDEVERVAGAPVASVFASEGEAAFRRLESAALHDALAGASRRVVSVGGGAVLDADNRSALRGAGLVVWLRARPATLAGRVGAGADRPLLADDAGGPTAALERLDTQRRPLYRTVADDVVDVDDLTADAVVDRVAALVAVAGRGQS